MTVTIVNRRAYFEVPYFTFSGLLTFVYLFIPMLSSGAEFDTDASLVACNAQYSKRTIERTLQFQGFS